MSKRSKTKLAKPDEVIENDVFAVGRFGKNLVWKSKLTKEGHAEYQKRCIELYPKTVAEIDQLVAAIADMVSQLPPDKLLHRAWWEMAAKHIKIEAEADVTSDEATSMRMIDYVQSVIASVKPAAGQREEVTEEEWKTLRENVDALFGKLNLTYQICRTAKAQAEDPTFNEDVEEFFYKAQIYWCNVRGSRYQVHEEAFLRDVFLPHTAVLEELFGITAEQFIQELMKIWNALTFGLQEAYDEMDSFRKDSLAAIQRKLDNGSVKPGAQLHEIMEEVVAENEWQERRDRVFGRLFGTDLYDVQKLTSLPKALLDELTWGQGEEADFFAEGEFRGWPLRIWPTFKRPFIRLGGSIYCFDLHGLFDNIYRVMQRIVLRLKPDYAETWKTTQQALSEELPLKYLEKILPGAKVYRSVHYKWKDWCEADGLVIYDDHLFIIEARGGAFTYTSPATDFPAFIASLKNLVLKPATQGKRFLDYLISADIVPIFDRDHKQIGELRKGDFRHISICPTTLDPFTEMAAQVQHLRKIGVDVGSHPVWAISVDDLRAYADIFENPLQFLHFAEQRAEAFRSDIIQADDELDHLGLYLEHNHYSAHAAEMRGKSDAHINFTGYRINIDKFFLERLHDPKCPCPLKQEAPARLIEIVDWLAKSEMPGRRKLAGYLLDLSGGERKRLVGYIEGELKAHPIRGRPLAYTTTGGNMIGYTVFCYTNNWAPRKSDIALSHAKQAMVLAQRSKHLLLELCYTDQAVLRDIHRTWVDASAIAPAEMALIKGRAEELRQTRLKNWKALNRKVGRNAPCPCGSGRKYKRCCLS